ncbi:hypothetical protein ACFWPH_12555 [Nocardia sp. NPDC058499]|uniref:WXG100 family type VII secretion target n=1 Tax=Nocardia sp. NPDC058499 TaxID=3346530 RepID=UPI003648D535
MTYQGQTGTTSTGTDPAYVPDREVFDAYTHQQIWDLARERLAPAELRRVADAWGRTADALESAFDEHARELTRLSAEWSGIAAAAAMQAATALVQAGDDTVEVCRAVRHLMTANSDAAESVRAAIPPPPEPYRPDPDSAVEAATGGQRRTTYNLAAAAATATAQDAMAFGYNPTIPASGDSVPRFPAVVATAPEGPGIPAVSRRDPGTDTGATPGAPETDPPESAPSHIDGATAPVSDRVGDGPQPSPGNDAAPMPTVAENESQSAGARSDSSPEAGSPADASGPPAESPQPDNTPAPDSSRHPDAPAADTAPAASSAPGAEPTRSEPAVQPSAAPVDRGTGTTGNPGVTDLSPRSPASPTTTGAAAPPLAGPGAATPIPAVPGPAGPAPAGPVPTSPPGPTGGGAGPGHGSAGGPPGPAPGSNTPQHRSASAIPPAGSGPAAAPYSHAPSVRTPAGHPEPVHPPLPGQREALGPAGTGPNSSTAEGHDHPGQRPIRLVPTGMPLPSTAGAPPARPPDSERTSPDYLHTANEELTATEPRVPPVLGEYTETERAERGDPGAGNR